MKPGRRIARYSPLDVLDGAFLTVSAITSVWLALELLGEVHEGWQLLLLLVFWVFVAYLLLPRLHRVLTHVYVPGYFIGRTRTSDGLLGDPVNLAFLGHEVQIHHAMAAAGWTRADDTDLSSSWRIVTSTLRRRSYPEAPVSPLHLFGRQQDFAYQQEVEGSPSRRHHVRFWRVPRGWRLPGGHAVDWLAAGTFDRSVGLSFFTLQVTHRISANIDRERDYIVRSLRDSEPAVEVEVIRSFSSGYHSRNGGGDRIKTDGDLPVVDVREVEAEERDGAALRERRVPGPTAFGAGVAVIRGITYAVLAVAMLLAPIDEISSEPLSSSEQLFVRSSVVGLLLLIAVADIGLGVATFAGRNWARLLLLLACACGSVLGMIPSALDDSGLLVAGLPVTASSILVLLALSSPAARTYAVTSSARADRSHPTLSSGDRDPQAEGVVRGQA